MTAIPWRFVPAAMAMLLAACGGGGDSGAPSGGQGSGTPAPTPAPPATSVTFSGNSLSITGDFDGGYSDDTSITFSIANRPAGGVWYRVTHTGSAVRTADLSFTTPASGQVRIGTWAPQQVGAGSYNSTVRIEICADSSCSSPVSGSPWSLSVSYTVSGNSGPAPAVHWQSPVYEPVVQPATFEGTPTVPLDFFVYYAPVSGLWIARVAPDTGIIRDVTLAEVEWLNMGLNVRGSFNVGLTPPAAVGSGIWRDRLRVVACFDPHCARIVPGSSYDFEVQLLVHAAEGVHYSVRTWNPANGATDVVWSRANSSLYVASSRSETLEAQVLEIKPDNAGPVSGWTHPGERITRIAVSDDGSSLFVNTHDPYPANPTSVLRRLSLPTLVEQGSQPLLQRGLYFTPDRVSDMIVPHGQTTSVLAALYSVEDNGIHVLDGTHVSTGIDAVPGYPALPRLLERGESSNVYYSLRGDGTTDSRHGRLDRFRVVGGAVELLDSFPLDGPLREVRYGGGRLFLRDGRILDASTALEVGRLEIPEGWALRVILADTEHSRVFGLAHNYYVLSFDMQTGKLLALAPLQLGRTLLSDEANARMVLHGERGLAIVDGTSLAVFEGTFVSSYDGSPTIPLPPNAPSPIASR